MRVNRSGRQKHHHSKLLGFCCFLLIAGVSFAGAYFWQPIQARLGLVRVVPVLAPAQEELIPPQGETAPQPEPTYPQLVSTPSAVPPTPSTALPDEPDLPEFAPGPFALSWQVAPSEPMDAAYFDNALFLGDSLLTGFVAHRLLPGASVLAVVGATPQSAMEEPLIPTAEGMATMLEAAYEMGPHGKVYIMLSNQSLGLGNEEFIEGYRQFVVALRAQFPGATVYIMGPPPVAAHVGRHHPELSRERVLELNTALSELARTQDLPFLNLFDALAGEDGYLPAHAGTDGLHLSAEYHFILLDFLKEHTTD